MSSIKRQWGWAILIIFLTALFQIHSIHTTYMRDDEEIAFRTTSRDLGYAIWYQAEQDVHAPLWFMSFWGWQQLAGSSEFMGRVYGILLSTLTLALLYQIGQSWFRNWRFGLFVAAGLGVNAYFTIYAMEIRPYPLIMLAATFSMWSFGRWLARRSMRTALIYGLSLALLLYIHYFLVFLILAQVIYFLLSRPTPILLRQGLSAAGIAFLLWLPWFPIFLNQIQKLFGIESETGVARGMAGIGSTTEPTSLNAILRLFNLASNGQIGLYGVVLLIGIIYAWRKTNYRLLLAWALGVPALALLINLLFAVYTPRYIAYMSVGVGAAAGVALAHLPGRSRWVALAAFAAISLWALPSQYPKDRVPHRLLFQQISAAAQPGDVLFFDKGDLENNVVRWQIRNYLTPDLWVDHVEAVDAIEGRRVWQITANWFNPDVQTNFRELEAGRPLQQVIGQCGRDWCYLMQLLEAPPWEMAKIFGETIGFRGADIDRVSATIIQTRLWWQAETVPPIDYSISLRLLDSAGILVAQADGPIRHYGETVNTSQMTPGKIYIDARDLTLPAALAAEAYSLEVLVYDSATGERLELADGANQLSLGTVQLPEHTS